MGEDTWNFVGHTVRASELDLIRSIVDEFGGLSRVELASTVCELLGWTRATGRLKARECRDLLERLDAARGVDTIRQAASNHSLFDQNVNLETTFCSWAAIWLSSCEAFCVSFAPCVVFFAAVATPPIFLAMSRTPVAASATLWPISLVVAVCSSTAEAMLLEMSLIWLMIELISSIAVTAPLVSP